MNIFLIPSWYPSKHNPISGVFTKEQSIMIAKTYQEEVSFFVSVVRTYPVSPKNIKQSIRNFIHYKKDKKEINKILDNYIEFFLSSLSWSNSILNGNLNGLVQSHRSTFKNIIDEGNKIDVIHAHVSYPAGYIAYVLSKEFNVPYIITEHMGPFPFDSYLKNSNIKENIKMAIEKSNETIAVSDSLQKDIINFGIKKEPIVINNFIDEDLYTIQRSSKDKFVFLTVGGMTYQKGIDVLLGAIKSISDIANIEFRIVGDGSQKEEYIKLSDEYNIANKVKFLGKLDRSSVVKEFESCDAFVLPSRHESFGVVYIEALACGKPLIATKCGGPESIVNYKNGILIEVGDSQALCIAMIEMIKNYSKYNQEAIRNSFLKKFSKKINTAKYMSIYNKVLQCAE